MFTKFVQVCRDDAIDLFLIFIEDEVRADAGRVDDNEHVEDKGKETTEPSIILCLTLVVHLHLVAESV